MKIGFFSFFYYLLKSPRSTPIPVTVSNDRGVVTIIFRFYAGFESSVRNRVGRVSAVPRAAAM